MKKQKTSHFSSSKKADMLEWEDYKDDENKNKNKNLQFTQKTSQTKKKDKRN